MSIGLALESSVSDLTSFLESPTVHIVCPVPESSPACVSEFRWCFARHRADLPIVIKFGSCQFLEARSSPMHGCSTACNISNRRPAVHGALPTTKCLQTSNPFPVTRVRELSSLNRNSRQPLFSLSIGTSLAANLSISETPVLSSPSATIHNF